MSEPARDDRQPEGSLIRGCCYALLVLPVHSVVGIVLAVLR